MALSRPRAVAREHFGSIDVGGDVDAITLANASGAEVQLLTYGATIRSIRVPDRSGVLGDVVLGYDTQKQYSADLFYMGGVIGRYANRIRNGQFELDGVRYNLPINDRGNHLHGGPHGFHTRIFAAEAISSDAGAAVRLRLESQDGDQGYPGNLEVAVTYTFTDANTLIVDYGATADRATPVSLTQHAYFNLRGACAGRILDHELEISADQYLATDHDLMPRSAQPVANTSFDFRAPRPIASDYDHCFVLREPGGTLRRAARLFDRSSGRTLEVLTTAPGMQLYTGHFLRPMRGKFGCTYDKYAGLCLETQHFPDAPNRADFPSPILRPGEQLQSTTVFRFGTRSN